MMWQGQIMKHALSENRNEEKKQNIEESRVLYGAPTTKRQKPNIIGLFLAGPDILAQRRRQNRGARRIRVIHPNHTPTTRERNSEKQNEREKKRWRDCVRPCV